MSQSGIERRRWARVPASSLDNVTAAIVAGPAVKLLDLSRGGALLEVASRFALRSSVRLKLTKPNGEVITVDGCVARAKVAALVNGQINYRFAVIFDKPLQDMPGLPNVAAADASPENAVKPAVAAVQQAPLAASASGGATGATAPAASGSGERTQPIALARANLTALPSVVAAPTENPPSSEAARELAERRRSIAADTRVDELRRALAASTAELARQSMVNQSLVAKLEEFDELRTSLRGALETERTKWKEELAVGAAELARQSSVNQSLAAELEQSSGIRTALREELETERRRWEAERAAVAPQVADSVARATALQAALDTRDREQAQALAEHQNKYEALIAELVKTTNDQQAEFQDLLDELTAARDEQRGRAEQLEAELAGHRAAEQQHRAESEASRRELEARLETAEALCAALEARDRGLRREVERLMSMFTVRLCPGASQPHDAAGETEANQEQAIA